MRVDPGKLAALRARARDKVKALAARPRPSLPTLKKRQRPARAIITDPRLLVAQQQRRRRRQRTLLIVLAIAVLLLLARYCECAPEPVVAVEPPPELVCPDVPECGVGATPKKKPPTTPKKKPPTATSTPLARDAFAVPISRSPPWLAALRMQVTARSLELAVCFNGAEKPGALRWTTTVTPSSGAVSDPELEPVLRGPPLTSPQQQCVLNVLAKRPYKLDANDDVGARVSLILEF